VPAFTYTHADLIGAAEALAGNVHPGTPWSELSEGDKGNLEADAEAVLRAVGGRETSA
jgi:hypothetical protein